jgi:hypothetical protein
MGEGVTPRAPTTPALIIGASAAPCPHPANKSDTSKAGESSDVRNETKGRSPEGNP